MSFFAEGVRRLDHVHAWLLACVCGLILLLGFPLPQVQLPSFAWSSSNSTRDEDKTDAALQQAAAVALAGREGGTIIIMDAQTGRVRALINPTVAYGAAQMPGSAMKPFTALTALRLGLIDEGSRTVCPGRFTGLSFSLPCTHADHLPPFSPAQAIAYSCNYYFASLGQRLGRDRIVSIAREFGFGQVTGVASDAEVAGVARPCETGSSSRVLSESNHASMTADCEARVAIGESEMIQVTPIQLITAYTALLNGGRLFQPNESGPATERSRINMAAGHRAVIVEGMAGAVRYGTARNAKLDALPLTILGKTGTATPAKGFRTNGWFIGFAGPFQSTRALDESQVELAVLVLLPRAHGSEAAAAARPIFEAYATAGNGQASNNSDSSRLKETGSGSSPLPDAASAVRVHLVHDNVTEELSLEDYVLGVMSAEGTMESQPEALKALAIAIRTFAIKNRGRHAKDGFDFCSTTHCQRFTVRTPTVTAGSASNDSPNSRAADVMIQAVRDTAGQILVDDHGEVADSYFGASCGGETANIGELWGVTPPGYLRGVRDEYCVTGPHAKWEDVITRANLLRALQSDSRTDVGNRLDQIVIKQRDETGRAEFLTLEGERRKTVRGWDFKIIVGRVLGWNVLKSSRFEVVRSGANFVFRGTGFGHGLGLCQEGAHVMGARGMNYQKILEKYFPGTSVKRDAVTRRPGDTAKVDANGDWKSDTMPIGFLSASRRFDFSSSRTFTISNDHFRVTYPADVDRREADQVLNTLESARTDFARRSSVNIPGLDIRLNESTGDFTARTGQPWWAAAATKGNRIELQPLSLLKRRGVLTTTLRHELAHVFIDVVSHNRSPRWLEEGFSIYLAGEGRLFAHYTRGTLSTDEIERRLEHPRTQSEMRELYAQAYVAVTELVKREGETSVWKKLSG